MARFLVLVATLAGLFSIVPLAMLAATGSVRKAFEAARSYALVMAFLVVPGVVLGLLDWFFGWIN